MSSQLNAVDQSQGRPPGPVRRPLAGLVRAARDRQGRLPCSLETRA